MGGGNILIESLALGEDSIYNDEGKLS